MSYDKEEKKKVISVRVKYNLDRWNFAFE